MPINATIDTVADVERLTARLRELRTDLHIPNPGLPSWDEELLNIGDSLAAALRRILDVCADPSTTASGQQVTTVQRILDALAGPLVTPEPEEPAEEPEPPVRASAWAQAVRARSVAHDVADTLYGDGPWTAEHPDVIHLRDETLRLARAVESLAAALVTP